MPYRYAKHHQMEDVLTMIRQSLHVKIRAAYQLLIQGGQSSAWEKLDEEERVYHLLQHRDDEEAATEMGEGKREETNEPIPAAKLPGVGVFVTAKQTGIPAVFYTLLARMHAVPEIGMTDLPG